MNRSIPSIAIAAMASVSFHLAGAHALWQPETADVAGGAEISPAQLGNSFQDIAQGISEPVATKEHVQDAPADSVADSEPPQNSPKNQPDEVETALSVAQQSTKMTLVTERLPKISAEVTANRLPDTSVTPLTTDEAGNPVLPSSTSQLALQSEPDKIETLQPLATTTPESAPQPTNTIETVQALPNPDEDAAAVQVSARPALRPKSIEQEAVKVAKTKQDRKKTQAAKKPRQTTQKPKLAQNKGSAQPNQRRGTATGQQTASRQNQAVGKTKKAQAAGNAAASNFKGLVQKRIARQRQPNIRGKGRVVVSFTIAGNGSLSSLGISQSSGRPELDQAAMQMVRRAAPFPKPPAGARRNWIQPMTVGR